MAECAPLLRLPRLIVPASLVLWAFDEPNSLVRLDQLNTLFDEPLCSRQADASAIRSKE